MPPIELFTALASVHDVLILLLDFLYSDSCLLCFELSSNGFLVSIFGRSLAYCGGTILLIVCSHLFLVIVILYELGCELQHEKGQGLEERQ